MKKTSYNWMIWLIVLSVLLVCVFFLSLSVGSVTISLKKIIASLFGKTDRSVSVILFDIRFPRILLGLAIGGALGLSGAILQGMFRNPLVEPYTLGIAGGAALGVCLNIISGFSKIAGAVSFPVTGFIGALIVIGLVYTLSMKRGLMRIQGLLLTGVMISFISSSLVMLLMAIAKVEDLHGIIFWIMGFLADSQWMLVKIAVFVSIAGLLVSYLFCRDLNAMSLGEEEALHLGVNVERTKRILFIITSVLIGCSVSITGIIGFVGLVVPHFVRMFIGRDYRILLIGSFLTGACFLVICDTLARTIISPMELPVGVITGILGGSLFVYALTKRQVAL
ncbi:FecCD family ABC transporter permease [Candidatus Auribacterota bacterium]